MSENSTKGIFLKARIIHINSNDYIIILNSEDAKKVGITLNDRVEVVKGNLSVVSKVHYSTSLINPGEVGVYSNVSKEIDAKDGDTIYVEPIGIPKSFHCIKKKIAGEYLSKDEIMTIVKDISSRRLTDLEMAAFVVAQQIRSMTTDEIEWLTRSIAESGTIIKFGKNAADKHSIGGVPGNKVSLLIVPIVAAAGILIPKTSSKAITSPSGTANTMEVLANVEFSADELKRIVNKTNGAIVWGGTLNLAPVDNILIERVEYPLQLNPHSQMLASIMAKKLATSIKYLVMDLPVGSGCKIATKEEAIELANSFIELGRRVGIQVACGVTYGGQPVGHAVGPALEAREALQAFKKYLPSSLVEKSVRLAGLLFEIVGLAERGCGANMAREIFMSGRAEAKFREIIEAQGGNPKITPEEVPVGDHVMKIVAEQPGYATALDNKAIVRIAKAAGAPEDPGAGVLLYGKVGHKFEKGDTIMEIYGHNATKVRDAYNLALQLKPITIESMLLEVIA
ncbi:MAG: AMP phosphorylase [Candidatus Korarchaeota archaeon]